MAPHVDAVALLGTNLSEAKVEEIIATRKYDRIYVCLDNDATWQAIKLTLKWKHRLPQLGVRGLGKDIKDMNDEEFTEFLLSIAPDEKPSASSASDSDS